MVFVVLALAPSPAKAHGGHSHSPVAISEQAPSLVKADVTAAAQAAAEEAAPQFASAASAPHGPPDNQNGCSGTCCKSAMACCVVIFTESGETPFPPGVASRLVFPRSDSWSSLTPDRLRRPPKPFA